MSLAALFSWLITAGGGLYLLTIWLIEYDHEFQSGAATRLPVPVISAHALLAITGLGLWGYYLFTDAARLAWVAVAILAIVAILGLIMAARWLVVYRAYRTPRVAVPAAGAHSASASLFSPAATESGGTGRGTRPGAPGWGTRPGAPGPPERHFPLPVVIGHGLLATVTIVFVVLTVLDVGGS
jgi:hypothetical protein